MGGALGQSTGDLEGVGLELGEARIWIYRMCDANRDRFSYGNPSGIDGGEAMGGTIGQSTRPRKSRTGAWRG